MDFPTFTVVGKKGAGKNLFATAWAHEYYKAGWTIIANYHLKKIPYRHMTLKDLALHYRDLGDSIIIMDECHVQNDAYNFFVKEVRSMDEFTSQLRKRRCILFMITQSFMKLATRLRNTTDYIIQCKNTDTVGVVDVSVFNRDVPEYESLEKHFILDGRPFYDAYDTNEIIEKDGSYTIPMPKREKKPVDPNAPKRSHHKKKTPEN